MQTNNKTVITIDKSTLPQEGQLVIVQINQKTYKAEYTAGDFYVNESIWFSPEEVHAWWPLDQGGWTTDYLDYTKTIHLTKGEHRVIVDMYTVRRKYKLTWMKAGETVINELLGNYDHESDIYQDIDLLQKRI